MWAAIGCGVRKAPLSFLLCVLTKKKKKKKKKKTDISISEITQAKFKTSSRVVRKETGLQTSLPFLRENNI